MDVVIFLDTEPCSPYEDLRFGATCYIHLQGTRHTPATIWVLAKLIFDPENRGDRFLRNVG
jgi:hypothetical protein